MRPGVTSLVLSLAVLLFAATGASAATLFPFETALVPAQGEFGELRANSVAVNDFNGETYVAFSEGFHKLASGVDVFKTATGAQLPAGPNGAETPAKAFSERIVIAANNTTGNVYVLDARNHNVVDVFDSANHYVCQITGAKSPSPSECNGLAGSETPAGGLQEPGAIAVDQATGDVYVLDAAHGVLDVFGPKGEYSRQFSLAEIPGGFGAEDSGLAVNDFNHDVYISNLGRKAVFVFDTVGYLETWTGANTPAGTFGNNASISVGVDNGDGDVFVGDTEHGLVDVFEPSGKYLTAISHGSQQVTGVALDDATGKVYVSVHGLGGSNPAVDVFGAGVTVPEAVTEAASEVQATSVTLHGAVSPSETQLTDCHFDFVPKAQYEQSKFSQATGAEQAPCEPAANAIPPDATVHPVAARLAALQSGTAYEFRLVAANHNDAAEPATGAPLEFTTLPRPTIDSASVLNLTAESAELSAQINPRGSQTTYRFEYGETEAYGKIEPVLDESIGAGTTDVFVPNLKLAKLKPDITYHWRVVATNANGPTVGADHTFIYDTSGSSLPDNRAYEMVTPPAKNAALFGGATLFELQPDISADGSRVIISSVQCFGNAEACNAAGGTVGSPAAFTRGTSGWTSASLQPPATEFPASTPWSISADSGASLFSAATPPAGEDDFYGRLSNGELFRIGPKTSPTKGPLGPFPGGSPDPVGTSDLSTVVWESKEQGIWPFDESIGPTVYEYVGRDNTAPTLVGVTGGVGSTSLISRCTTLLGGSGDLTVNSYGSLSESGGTIYFTAFQCGSGSGENAGVPVPADTLYARIDRSQTVKISGRGEANCTTAECLSSEPRAAKFEGASTNGAKVFFTDTQQLVNTATEDKVAADTAKQGGCSVTKAATGCNLYVYDFSRPEQERLVDVSAGEAPPAVQGVVAISADGSHVYFVARGALTKRPNMFGASAKQGADNLYVYNATTRVLDFVTVLPAVDAQQWINGIEHANVTPDGRFLVFESHGALTPDDARPGPVQIFRYDAETGRLVRVSIGEHGFNDNGNAGSGDASIVPAEHSYLRDGPGRANPTMSNDGSFVFFQSPIGLTPHALNDVQIGTGEGGAPAYAENVYEYHAGNVALISDGRDVSRVGFAQSAVKLIGSDASGANVFFTTADQLAAQDTDTQTDVYDARICEPEKGNPCIAPAPAPSPPCLGEACHGTPAATPLLPGVPSLSFNGAGNVTPPPPPKALTNTHRLAKALSSCRKKYKRQKRRRIACERQAHRAYGATRARRAATTASNNGRVGG